MATGKRRFGALQVGTEGSFREEHSSLVAETETLLQVDMVKDPLRDNMAGLVREVLDPSFEASEGTFDPSFEDLLDQVLVLRGPSYAHVLASDAASLVRGVVFVGKACP